MVQGKSGARRKDGKEMILKLEVEVIDPTGSVVREITDEKQIDPARDASGGTRTVTRSISTTWDGNDDNGNRAPDGNYTAKASGELILRRDPPNANNQNAKSSQALASSDAGTTKFLVDNTKPTLSNLVPEQDAFIATLRPEVSGDWTDPLAGITGHKVASGLDLTSAEIMVNGVDLSGEASTDKDGFTATPPVDLNEGSLTLTVKIKDRAGNQAIETSEFVVDVTAPDIAVSPCNQTVTAGSDFGLTIIIDDTKDNVDTVSGVDTDEIEITHNDERVEDLYTVVEEGTEVVKLAFVPTVKQLGNLVTGQNVIKVTAPDRAGNSDPFSCSLTIQPAPDGPFKTGEPFKVKLTPIKGNGQKVLSGQPLNPEPDNDNEGMQLKVKATDPETGEALPNVPIRWKFSLSGTRIIPPYNEDGTTDENGEAETNIRVSHIEEEQKSLEVTATVEFAKVVGGPANFSLTVLQPEMKLRVTGFGNGGIPVIGNLLKHGSRNQQLVFVGDPTEPGSGVIPDFPPPLKETTVEVLAGTGEGENFKPFKRVKIDGSDVEVNDPPFLFHPPRQATNDKGTTDFSLVALKERKEKYTIRVRLPEFPNVYKEVKVNVDKSRKEQVQITKNGQDLSDTAEVTSFIDKKTNGQFGLENQELPKPLRVKASDMIDSVRSVVEQKLNAGEKLVRDGPRITFTVSSTNLDPDGGFQSGKFSNGKGKISITGEETAEANFTPKNNQAHVIQAHLTIGWDILNVDNEIIGSASFGHTENFSVGPVVPTLKRPVMKWTENGGVKRVNGKPDVVRNDDGRRLFEIIGRPGTLGPGQVIEPKFPVTTDDGGNTVPRHVDEKDQFFVQTRMPANMSRSFTAKVFSRDRTTRKTKNVIPPGVTGTGHGPFARAEIEVNLFPAKVQPNPDRYTLYRSEDPVVTTGQGTDVDDIGGGKTGPGGKFVKKLPPGENFSESEPINDNPQYVVQYRGDGRVQTTLPDTKDQTISQEGEELSARKEIMQKVFVGISVDSMGIKQDTNLFKSLPKDSSWHSIFGFNPGSSKIDDEFLDLNKSFVEKTTNGVRMNVEADWPPITFANWTSIYTTKSPRDTLIPGNNFWMRFAGAGRLGNARKIVANKSFRTKFLADLLFPSKIPLRMVNFASPAYPSIPRDKVTIPRDLGASYFIYPRKGKIKGHKHPGLLNMVRNTSRLLDPNQPGYKGNVNTIFERATSTNTYKEDQMWGVMLRNTSGLERSKHWIKIQDAANNSRSDNINRWTVEALIGNIFGTDLSKIEAIAEAQDIPSKRALINRMDSSKDARLFMIYLPGHDYMRHMGGKFPANNYLRKNLNRQLGKLKKAFKDNGLLANSVWFLMSDHGQHNLGTGAFLNEVSENSKVARRERIFQISQEELNKLLDIDWPPLQNKVPEDKPVKDIFDIAKATDESELPSGPASDFPAGNIVSVIDDSIAHVYVLEGKPDAGVDSSFRKLYNPKQTPSRERIMRIAQKFFEISQNPVNMNRKFKTEKDKAELKEWIGKTKTTTRPAFGLNSRGVILVKFPNQKEDTNWSAKYRIFRGLGKEPISIEKIRKTGKKDKYFPKNSIPNVVREIQKANSIRMGTIVLIPDPRFYFETEIMESGHGSFLTKDAYVPFRVGMFPKSENNVIPADQQDFILSALEGFRDFKTTGQLPVFDQHVQNSEILEFVEFLMGIRNPD